MNSEWLGTAGDRLTRSWDQLNQAFHHFSDPQRVQKLRYGVYMLAALWLAISLSQLVWELLPQPFPAELPSQIANPIQQAVSSTGSRQLDVEVMAAWQLFGSLAAPVVKEPVKQPELTAATSLEGIEKNARETRLALKLQGVVASSDPDIAQAVIEHKNKQARYRIGDKLPVGGRVSVAKILADRVVLDNAGKYELLKLFDKDGLSAQPLSAAAEPAAPRKTVDNRQNQNVAEMAQQYRQRLYRDPTSLAQVVRISAVRDGDQLRGYRVSPGSDRDQFEQLGFRPGDVVTSVNGIALTDPGKAMELYRIMRSATEASFDVARGDENLTISVSFDAADTQ